MHRDLNKIDESIEHLWIECKGSNCNKSYLVAVLYQPSSDEKKKLIWIEKLDTLPSIINSTWNKTIIMTGDTNIDYLKPSVALKRYKEVIETYSLKQHIAIYHRVKGLKSLIISSPTYKKTNLSPQMFYYVQPLVIMMYVIADILGIKFQTRTKYIQNMKHSNIKEYVDDFKTLPLALSL